MGGRYSAHLSATRKTGPILKPSALISEFVENGFVTMPSSLEAGVHSGLYESTKHLFRSMRDGFNPHNNVLPMLPALWDVLDDPQLQSALRAIVGDHYLIHPHRHPHITPPTPNRTAPGMMQHFHKDGHAMKPRPRHREPWWLILFYYPQAVTLNNGPTGVLPCTHVLPELMRGDPDGIPEIKKQGDDLILDQNFFQRRVSPITCPAGTMALCHFDVGHGAMLNVSEEYRWAIKFVVMRTERPTIDKPLNIPTDNPVSHHLVSWLGHNAGEALTYLPIGDWLLAIKGDDSRARVNALYASGVVDDQISVRDVLMKEVHAYTLDEDTIRVLDCADACNGLALLDDKSPIEQLMNSDHYAVQANGCFAAGQSGESSFANRLIPLVNHDHPFVQRHAMSALGTLAGGDQRDAAMTALADVAHRNEDWDRRLFAVQALIRLGRTPDLIDILKPVARDPNTYVQSFAIEQLCRIDDPAAREAVLEPLRRQRWMDDPRYHATPGRW